MGVPSAAALMFLVDSSCVHIFIRSHTLSISTNLKSPFPCVSPPVLVDPLQAGFELWSLVCEIDAK